MHSSYSAIQLFSYSAIQLFSFVESEVSLRKAGVTTDRVIETAARIADSEGLATLTLARLAKALGIRPPSLYKHVDGLEAVLRAVSLRGILEANGRLQRATIGKARDEALRALAHAYWQFARERPGLYAASLRPAEAGDRDAAIAGEALIGTLLSVLGGYGLTGSDLRHAARGLRAVIHGFVSLDASGAFRLKGDLTESFDRVMGAFARDLATRAS